VKLIHVLTAAAAVAVLATPAAAQDAAAPVQETTPAEAAEAAPAAPAPVTLGDLTEGAAVRGSDGNPVGTIEFADGEGATVTTGSAKLYLRLSNFIKDEQGLVIGATRAQFEAAAAQIAAGS
jgi:opacity protein-like surface antigen